MNVIQPLRDNIYIERVVRKKTLGGILIPKTYAVNGEPRLVLDATRDEFLARVLGVGPKVVDVKQGDYVLVLTFAMTKAEGMYTGISVGERDRVFIKADDIVCLVDLTPEEEALEEERAGE